MLSATIFTYETPEAFEKLTYHNCKFFHTAINRVLKSTQRTEVLLGEAASILKTATTDDVNIQNYNINERFITARSTPDAYRVLSETFNIEE